MTRNIFFLILSVLLFSCSDNDPLKIDEGGNGGSGEGNKPQDYTSFTLRIEEWPGLLPLENCIVGYKGTDGVWIKLADLGTVGTTKSKEVKIDENLINSVYMFSFVVLHPSTTETNRVYARTEKPLSLKSNQNNDISFDTFSVVIVDPTDPTQCPQ